MHLQGESWMEKPRRSRTRGVDRDRYHELTRCWTWDVSLEADVGLTAFSSRIRLELPRNPAPRDQDCGWENSLWCLESWGGFPFQSSPSMAGEDAVSVRCLSTAKNDLTILDLSGPLARPPWDRSRIGRRKEKVQISVSQPRSVCWCEWPNKASSVQQSTAGIEKPRTALADEGFHGLSWRPR